MRIRLSHSKRLGNGNYASIGTSVDGGKLLGGVGIVAVLFAVCFFPIWALVKIYKALCRKMSKGWALAIVGIPVAALLLVGMALIPPEGAALPTDQPEELSEVIEQTEAPAEPEVLPLIATAGTDAADQQRSIPETLPGSSEAEAVTVWIASSGDGIRYHKEGCRTLTGPKEEITLEEAERRGYTPCKICGG